MTPTRTPYVLALVLALLLLPAPFSRAAEAQQQGGGLFSETVSEPRDSGVLLRWRLDEAKAREAGVKGVRVYSITAGDEVGFNVKALKLVKDCGTATQLAIEGLVNGSLTNYLLKAYTEKGDIETGQVVPGLPGAASKGPPAAVQGVYTASGPSAVAVFWERSPEAATQAYEVSRKAQGESEFTVVGRFPKVMGVNHPTADKSARIFLPALRPCIYRDATVQPGVAYAYRVRVVDAKGQIGPEAVSQPAAPQEARSPEPSELLLLTVAGDESSLAVARYYASKRKVPLENILKLKLPASPHLFRCEEHVAKPLREFLLSKGLAGKIRVFVPCFGMPLGDGSHSLDSMLTDLFGRYTWGRTMGTPNPFFGADAHFDPTAGLYLAARLDGPDLKTAMALVDKAMEAEATVTVASGTGFFVDDENGKKAAQVVRDLGGSAETRPGEAFKTLTLPDSTMWLFGLGTALRKIRDTPWPTGSVAAFLKSDTLLEVRDANPRSWVHGLLADGVTATFGAVIEPYVQGYTRGDIFFERFLSGKYSFVESFFMATPTVRWAMTAVGDPLYKVGKPKKGD